LEEIAMARLVEAYARSARPEDAAALARRYAERFPRGTYRAEVERWSRAH